MPPGPIDCRVPCRSHRAQDELWRRRWRHVVAFGYVPYNNNPFCTLPAKIIAYLLLDHLASLRPCHEEVGLWL